MEELVGILLQFWESVLWNVAGMIKMGIVAETVTVIVIVIKTGEHSISFYLKNYLLDFL